MDGSNFRRLLLCFDKSDFPRALFFIITRPFLPLLRPKAELVLSPRRLCLLTVVLQLPYANSRVCLHHNEGHYQAPSQVPKHIATNIMTLLNVPGQRQ